MPKKKAVKTFLSLPAGLEIGKNCTYYSNGWHTGRLDKVDGNFAGIHVFGGTLNARLKWINIGNIKKGD